MEREKIEKMFEGRWRVFGNGDDETKRLCHDFFEAGITLSSTDAPSISLSAIIDADVEVNGFDFFWNSYDKKVGRPKCEKLWEKLSLKEKKECLDYIPLYKQAQPDKQYRKNPETFLRNKSWNDELIYRNNGQPTKQERDLQRLADILTG